MRYTESITTERTYYDEALLKESLYPRLELGALGRMMGGRTLATPFAFCSGGFDTCISSMGYPSQRFRNPFYPASRPVERMLRCDSCGSQYLLREAAETVDKAPLVRLECKYG